MKLEFHNSFKDFIICNYSVCKQSKPILKYEYEFNPWSFEEEGGGYFLEGRWWE
jgi:hypothetical protein